MGACTDAGRTISGIYLGINHSTDSNKLDMFTGSRMLGEETSDASVSTMFSWVNEQGAEQEGLIIDLISTVYLGEPCKPPPPTPAPPQSIGRCGPPPEVLECYYMPQVDDTTCEQEAIAQAWCDCIGYTGECPIGDPSSLCFTGDYDCWGEGESEMKPLCNPENEWMMFVAPCDCSVIQYPEYRLQCEWACKDLIPGRELEFCALGFFSADPWYDCE